MNKKGSVYIRDNMSGLKIIMIILCLITVCGCGGEKKVVHCDRCGAEVQVKSESKVEESWTIYCDKCDEELGLNKKIIEIIESKEDLTE